MNLPERLMKLRKAAGLSQEEVADKLEVTRQTVSKWETGQSSPDLDKVLPLCELYNVTPDELLQNGGMTDSDDLFVDTEQRRMVEEEKQRSNKKLCGVLGGSLLYVVAIAWIMVSIPVLHFNPVASSAIMLLIIAIATIIIIYSAIAFRKVKEVKKEITREEKLYKQIDSVLSVTTLAIYLIVSFMTMAWHITWIIWIVYALAGEIVKLAIEIKLGKDSKNEEQ
jgi:transcriptional regulator with XRE-family HTH domain